MRLIVKVLFLEYFFFRDGNLFFEIKFIKDRECLIFGRLRGFVFG